jgi:hypothetical protein
MMEMVASSYVQMYIIIGYTVLSMIGGAVVARCKRDFASRGMSICMFSGVFGLLAMILSAPSRAREGEKSVWPDRAPEACVLNIVAVGLFKVLA